jgi:hypothetical protein
MLNNYFFRISGCIFIGAYIYFRIIYKRLPRDLALYDTLYTLFPFAILCIISCFMGYYYFKILKHKPFVQLSPQLTKIIKQISEYIKDSLFAIYIYFIEKVDDSYNKVKRIITYFLKYFGHKEFILCLAFEILPYIIVNIFFCIDVFIFFRLNYFYKSLIILIIPVIFRIWLYIINDFTHNMKIIEQDFFITSSFNEDGSENIKFDIKPEVPSEKKPIIVTYNIQEYLSLIPLKRFIDSYEILKDYYKPRIMLFVCLSYAIGWSYIIYTNLICI